jgi:hypothetical protein
VRNFQIIKRPWSNVAADLEVALKAIDKNPMWLESQTGVKHHAIRRMRNGLLKNRTDNAEKLCAYFEIPLIESEKLRISDALDFTQVIQRIWDGSQAHAELIIKLIESTHGFSVRKENKSTLD